MKHISEILAPRKAQLEAQQSESENVCEKCGGETGSKMIGDESYQKCRDCGWVTVK